MRKNIEKQFKMKKEDPTLISNYNEAIMQFGFIALFANTVPYAPIFSMLVNMLEIKIKSNSMCHYSRRGSAESASGIGAWMQIMEVIAIICIPVNVAIIYFTGDGDFKHSGQSSFIKFFSLRDPEFWNQVNIIWLAIFVEHALIIVKVIIGMLILDVPAAVIEAEKKRPKIEKKARDHLNDHTKN